MKDREEVAQFINEGRNYSKDFRREKCSWHFGLLELRDLMDFIYGEQPKSEEEHINTISDAFDTIS